MARTASLAFSSPLADEEVVKTALSAWKYEAEGKNWISRGKRRPDPTEPIGLILANPDAFILWHVLRPYNGGRARFVVTNAMAPTMPGGWKRERLAAARKALVDHGYIALVKAAFTGCAAVYVWGS